MQLTGLMTKNTSKKKKSSKPKKSGTKRKAAAAIALSPPSLRNRFTKGFVQWLKDEDFIVGLPDKDIDGNVTDMREGLAQIGKIVDGAGIHLGVPLQILGFLIQAGATERAAARALRPYMRASNIIAVNTGVAPTLIAVLFCDALPNADVLDRFDFFIEEKPGLEIFATKILGMGTFAGASVLPFLVFFQRDQYERRLPELSEEIEKADPSEGLTVCFVNVPDRQVEWRKPVDDSLIYRALKEEINWLDNLGRKQVTFDDVVLEEVMGDV